MVGRKSTSGSALSAVGAWKRIPRPGRRERAGGAGARRCRSGHRVEPKEAEQQCGHE